jgi:hypothetical protein
VSKENNESKKGPMKWEKWLVIGTFLLALFTLFMALFTLILAKSNIETTEHISKIMELTNKNSHHFNEMKRSINDITGHIARMVQSTEDSVKNIVEMAQSMAKVTIFIEEIAQTVKKPILTVYFAVKADFKFNVTNDGIFFKANAYLDCKKQADFYAVAKNEWGSNIKSNLEIGFKVSVINTDKNVVQSNTYYKENIPLDLEPSEEIEITDDLNEFEEQLTKLEGKNFNWRGPISDKIIKIELDRRVVTQYKHAYVNVEYWEYEKFNQKFLKKKNSLGL